MAEQPSTGGDRRHAELDQVLATYRAYQASSHHVRWSLANPGQRLLTRQARRAVAELLGSVIGERAGRLLDLGCGDGWLAEAARLRGLTVEWWGVDLQADAISLAQDSHPWAKFAVAPADALPFTDHYFDVVVTSVVFSSLPSQDMEERSALEISRVLRPGGTLVWYDMRYPSLGNASVHPMGRGRLRDLFPGWPVRLRSITLIPPLARRLGPATSVLYGLLHAIPPMRSHLIGVITKPLARPNPRILLVTGLWPTPDRPSAGAFVRDRVADDSAFRVVGPRRYDQPTLVRYIRLLAESMTARGRFDGVEAHVLFPSGVIGLLAAWVRRLPLVVYVHGDEVRHAVYRNPIWTWLARRVSRRAAAVVVNSADTARYSARLGGPEPVINPPGIDLRKFRPTPRPPRPRILYVGGDRPEKGVEIARAHADTLAGPHLREIDPDLMPQLMAEHDVLLMPSREEGFGLAAAEAIASGRWVVAAAVGGLVDVVTDGVNGTLVRDGDYAGALAAVPDYDPEAVAATAQRFGIEAHREGLRQVWDRVLAR